jgi:sensor domain CHASE-containing protein
VKKGRISLRFAIILILGIGMLVFTAVFVSLARIVMPNILFQSESAYLQEQRDVVAGLFETAQQKIVSLTGDMAVWKDTCEFIRGNDPDYIARNWPELSVTQTYQINYLFIKDRAGRDVYFESADFANGGPMYVPSGMSEFLNPFAETVLADYEAAGGSLSMGAAGLSGIVFYRGIAFFISIMPVIESLGTAESEGTLIFAVMLGNDFFRYITFYKNVDFLITPGTVQRETREFSFLRLNSSTVSVQLPLADDIQGGKAFLVMERTRTVHALEEKALNQTVFFLICGFLFFVLALYMFTIQFLVRPLELLFGEIYKADATNRLDVDKYSRFREFRALAASINDMLENLRRSSLSAQAFRDYEKSREPRDA